MTDAPAAAIWLTNAQLPLARATVDAAGVRVCALGAPASSLRGEAAERREALAATFPDGQIVNDLRQLLTSADVSTVLIMTGRDGDDRECLEDADVLEASARRGVRLLTLEPAPAQIRAARRMTALAGREIVRFAPRFDLCPGMVASADVREALGAARSAHYAARCRPEHGSLGARLFDAMSIIHMTLGEPEFIDASLVSIRSQSGLHLAPPEDLWALTGDLHAHLRYAGTRSATVSVSDRSPRWERRLTLLGDGGLLTIHEDDFEFVNNDGTIVDERDVGASAFSVGEWLGGQWALLLDAYAPVASPLPGEVTLSMAHAALLSARTGQPECPATIRRMG